MQLLKLQKQPCSRYRWILLFPLANCILYLLALLENRALHGQSPNSIETLFPSNVAALLKIEPTGKILDQETITKFRKSEAFNTFWRSHALGPLRGGLALAELALGDKLETIVRKTGADGIAIVLDGETSRWIAFSDSGDAQWITAFQRRLIDFVRNDAKNKGSENPIREATYRSHVGYEFQKTYFTTLGSTLIVTNSPKLAKETVDRFVDGASTAVRVSKSFQQYRDVVASDSREPSISGFIDLKVMRQLPVTKNILQSKPLDFLAELLVGGAISTLRNTDTLCGKISTDSDAVRLVLSTPYDPSWNEPQRSFFVGPKSRGFAPSYQFDFPILASVGAYRNVAEMWMRAGDLFDERVNEQLANADNTLTTLFSGKDVGTDILGAIEPTIQFVAAEPSFEDANKPAILLPSFGVIASLKDVEMRRDLKRTYQSLIGFLNIVGAQQGRPQLDLENSTSDGAQFYFATYVRDKPYIDGLPIEFNFSPTLAFKDERICLASTRALAERMLRASKDLMDVKLLQANTHASVQLGMVRQLIEDNRAPLIAQNMLEKGQSKAEAEAEIEIVQRIVALFQSARASLIFDAHMQLELVLELSP